MLMPQKLQQPEMSFIDVEDIKAISTSAQAPKTQAQLDRDTMQQVLDNDKYDNDLVEKEREKTVKCLLKVMQHDLDMVGDQARDIQDHYKKLDNEIDDYHRMLNSKENQIIMDDLKAKMKQAQMAEEGFSDIGDEELM